jgi:hypothetical protein
VPPGVGCRPAPRGEDEARLNPDRGRLEPLDRWLALTDRNRAAVAGDRGMSPRECRLAMTRLPVDPYERATDPQKAVGEVDVRPAQGRASPRLGPVGASRRISGAYATGQ